MSKTYLIGPAEETIKAHLSQSGDPLEAIRTIQKIYGLDLPGIEALYPLLDLAGYSRQEVHRHCLDALNKAIMERIENPEFTLEDFHELYQRTSPHIAIPLMQPIPMALLKKFEKHVSEEVLSQLKSNPNVFENCPLNIKQRLWKQDEVFFQEQMLTVLNDYHHNEQLQTLAMNLKPESYQGIIEERRSHPIIIKIMDIIGGDPKLYTMFMTMLRLVFEATPYPSLSSLRVDLLMNVHDQDIEEVYKIDECHQLIWSLDTCIRSQNMDEAIIGKIKECFDKTVNGQPLYAEFAMILMDPIISNFLSACIVRWLRNSVDEGAPGNLEDLINYNAKLLNLAEHALSATGTDLRIPKIDRHLRTHFWNDMCAIIVNENTPTTAAMTLHNVARTESVVAKSEVARKIYVHYLVDRVHEGDIALLSRCLPSILSTLPEEADKDRADYNLHVYTYQSFFRTFIDVLVKRHLMECVVDPRWRQGVVEEFLMVAVTWDVSVHIHMVKMLNEYFKEPKCLLKLGEQVAVIADWADKIFMNGRKEEKDIPMMYNLYYSLLRDSALVLDGQFRIAPPAVMNFCSSMV
ncbi:cofactor of BRCA1-domain-containing protein [Spinellus fusiger]|nr:cofactor of BRCA1-domain-containing protein [Spinellus fusiger]